jgi:membrane protease YdiL (CAAX protease family)
VGAYASFQDEGSGIYFVLMLIGLMVPFLLSLVMIFTSKNPQLKRDFVNRLTNPKLIRVQMLPVLFLLMPLSVVLSILFSVPFGGSLAQFEFAEEFSFTSGFVPVLLLLILAACFEELGWRGYAFESLETRYTYFTASVIFSILWSLWHFPLIFVNGSYQYEVLQENIWYATNFFVSIIPMGIIVSWFCIKNRKSILAAVVFHFLINISQEMMNITQTTKCVQTFVLTAFVAIIVFMEKDLFFSREHLTGKKGYFTGKMTHG